MKVSILLTANRYGMLTATVAEPVQPYAYLPPLEPGERRFRIEAVIPDPFAETPAVIGAVVPEEER